MGAVIGFDVGIRPENPSAWAVIQFDPLPQLITSVHFWSNTKSWENRVSSLGKQAYALINDFRHQYPVSLVAVEIPFYGGDGENAMTTIKLASVVGAIFGAAHPIPVIAVAPAQGKKALAKNGQATKADMVEAARIKWGVEITDHEAAAAGVALAGVILQIKRLNKTGQSVKALSQMFGIEPKTIEIILKQRDE